ncbi:MAG: hypothetical protein ACOCRN_03030 [Spirochaetia bacterium]
MASKSIASDENGVSRVTRTKAQARKNYDRLSPFYDWVAGVFELYP